MQLLTLSFAMFLGSFVAGAIPLTISLSEVGYLRGQVVVHHVSSFDFLFRCLMFIFLILDGVFSVDIQLQLSISFTQKGEIIFKGPLKKIKLI